LIAMYVLLYLHCHAICDLLMNRKTVPVCDRQFWEKEAGDYPPGIDASASARCAEAIAIMERQGVVFNGPEVLDIGCGTGAFTLHFAERGAAATALDISEGMLERLKNDAGWLSLENITTARADWRNLDIDASGFRKAFDIVFCGFSTAVENRRDIETMESCSRHWCGYAATGEVKRNAKCRELLRAVNAPFRARPDIRVIRARLASMGRRASYECFPKIVNEKRSRDEIRSVLINRLEASGRLTDRLQVESAVSLWWETHCKDSNYAMCEGEIEIGVLLWSVNES
jgi:SAM-dependent methyltransferase